jgi:hypothetical protein
MDMAREILGGWVDTLKSVQLVQKLVIKLLQHLCSGPLDPFEINQQAVGPQFFARDKDLNLPVVSVQLLALPLNAPQPVGGGNTGNDFQFIQMGPSF